MKFDEEPMHQPPSMVDPKLTFVDTEHPYPEPVSEGTFFDEGQNHFDEFDRFSTF